MTHYTDIQARKTELRQLMDKHGWTVDDVCQLLSIDGQPRRRHTVASWLQGSQRAVIPDDCLEILRLRIKLDACQKQLRATATESHKPRPQVNRRRG